MFQRRRYVPLVSVLLGLSLPTACKPTASQGGPQYPAIDTNKDDSDPSAKDAKKSGADKSSRSDNATVDSTPPTAPTGTGATTSPTNSAPANNASGFGGGFLDNLLSQFGGGSGLGGLAGGLTGALSGLTSGQGGFDFGSLLNSFGGFGGGNASPSSPAPAIAVTPTSNLAELRDACLATINQYRATKGRAALTLKNDDATNSCVDQQSANDGAAGAAHRNFGKCGESAQNECPGWGGDPANAQNGCLQMMWNEGPGGGHYENMNNPAYRQVSCGFAQVGGKWWMIQNFYR